MQFKVFSVIALGSILAAANGIAPSQCSTGTTSDATVASLLGLVGVALGSVTGLVGITCSPISLVGLNSASCSAQPVCCTNNSFNGVVALGCTPVDLSFLLRSTRAARRSGVQSPTYASVPDAGTGTPRGPSTIYGPRTDPPNLEWKGAQVQTKVYSKPSWAGYTSTPTTSPSDVRPLPCAVPLIESERKLIDLQAASHPTGIAPKCDPSPGFHQFLRHVAPNAIFDGAKGPDRGRCHRGTRKAVLQRLTERALDPGRRPLTWLYGPMGGGKSSIMRSLAKRLKKKGRLLASFFFSASPGCTSSASLVPTIVYQLCLSVEGFRSIIDEHIQLDPLVLQRSLKHQVECLVLRPLEALPGGGDDCPGNGARTILVDGLEDCVDPAERESVLDALHFLCTSFKHPLSVIIASRSTPDIRAQFDSRSFAKKTSKEALHLDITAAADIKQFFLDKFDEIQQTHAMRSYLPLTAGRWPSLPTINLLVKKASRQFIFAAIVIRFVSCPRSNPNQRVRMILGGIPSKKLRPFRELDSLHKAVLASLDSEDLPEVLVVLRLLGSSPSRRSQEWSCIGGDMVLNSTDGLHLKHLDDLLGGHEGYCAELLSELQSIGGVDDSGSNFEFYHESFHDFLCDEGRSGQYFVSLELCYEDLLRAIILADFWSQDVACRTFMVTSFATLLDLRHPSDDILSLIQKIDFIAMDERVRSKCEATTKASPSSWPWILCEFVQILGQSSLPNQAYLYALLASRLRELIRRRLEPYLRSPELWCLLYMATRRTTSSSSRQTNEILTLARALLRALPYSLVETETRDGLGLLTFPWDPDRNESMMLFVDQPLILETALASVPELSSPGDYYVSLLRGLVRVALGESTISSLLAHGDFLRVGVGMAPESRTLAGDLRLFLKRFVSQLGRDVRICVQSYCDEVEMGGFAARR